MHLYYVKFPFGAWYYFYEACSHWCFWLLPTDFHHCEVFYLMNIPACIYLFCYWWCWGYWIVPLGIFVTYISVHFKESFVFSGDGGWYKDTENKLKTAGEESCKKGVTAVFSFRSKVKQETAKQTGRRGRPKHFPVQSIPERLAWFQSERACNCRGLEPLHHTFRKRHFKKQRERKMWETKAICGRCTEKGDTKKMLLFSTHKSAVWLPQRRKDEH